MRRMQESRFAFGPFVLDSGAGTLLRNDVPVAVGYRGLKLLAALVGRPGEILGKAEVRVLVMATSIWFEGRRALERG